MLTLKCMHTDGAESVREVIEARCVQEPHSPRSTDDPGHHLVVYAEMPNGCTASFDKGTIYVMNGDGATVAKWDLGGWSGPPQLASR